MDVLKLLDGTDHDEVRRLGFETFMKLKMGNISKRQAIDSFVSEAVLKNGRIAIHIRQGVILYITPEVIF